MLNRYRVESSVDLGGQAFVYRGIDFKDALSGRDVPRVVCIKQFHDMVSGSGEAAELVQHYANFRDRLTKSEQYICLPISVGEDHDSVIAVFPWINGSSLDDLMNSGLSSLDRIRIARGLAIAIQSLHREGVAHLDLSPGNVMIRKSKKGGSYIRLIDLDAARIDGNKLRSAVIGQINYASPEHRDPVRFGEVGYHSDMFSLGVVLLELLTGVHPFPAWDPRSEPGSSFEPRIPANDYHRKVIGTLVDCLSSNPEKRPKASQVVAVIKNHFETHLEANAPQSKWQGVSVRPRYYVQLTALKGIFRRTYYDEVHLNGLELRGSGLPPDIPAVVAISTHGDGFNLERLNSSVPVFLDGREVSLRERPKIHSRHILTIFDEVFDLCVLLLDTGD